MIDIHLHGALRNLVDESLQPLRLDINSPGEAYFALRQLPGFAQAIREGSWRWLIDDAQEVTQDDVGLLLRPGASLHIYPCAEGDGFIIDFFRGVFNFIGSLFFPSLSGYDTDAVDERASYLFNGPVNTVEQGGCVPLVYGEVETGGYTLSVGVSSARLTPPRKHLPDSVKGKAAEFENTLQTGATIRIVDLISEGEIEGLVNGAQSVFLDGVPVQDSAGNEVVAVDTPSPEAAAFNFRGWGYGYGAPASGAPGKNQNYKGVKVDSRNGTADQSPLDGIPAIETERNVNLKVTTVTPRTQAIQASGTDTARVTIRFPRLVEVTKKADRIATKVRFAIDVQAAGEAGFTTRLNQTIHDKNNSPAEISYDIPLEGNAPWNVRVRRITPDSQKDTVHNEIWWARLTEIQEVRQTYPHSAVVGIVAEAEKFDGDISKRKYHVRGKIVLVPSNYDPIARTYAGAVWDGTFKRAWTNNGAWVVYDILVNRRFGLGQQIDPAYLSAIKWGLYEIAQFNDVDVRYDALTGPAGYDQEALRFSQPVSEPRFTFNGVLQKQGDAKKVIDNVLSNFHSAAYYGGGAVVPVQDSPAEPEFLLTNANVEEGDIHYSDLAHRDRVSVVNVSFNNPENGYKLEPEPVVNDNLVAKYGHRTKNLVSMFNTSRAQAHRFGRLYLFEQEHESDTASAKTGMDIATRRPGAVGKIADRYTAGVRTGCRLVSYDAAEPAVILDDMSGLASAADGAWAANVVLADGDVATVGIDRFLPAQHKIVLAAALPSAPLPGAVTALEKTGVSARLVRLVGMKETDDPLGYELAVKAYHAGKYPAVEANLNVVVPSYRISDAERYRPVTPPDLVTLDAGDIEDAGAVRPTLTISVAGGDPGTLIDFGLRGPFADGAEDEAEWFTIERSSLRTLAVPGLLLGGTYRARARTVNSTLTARSAWVESDTASISDALGQDVGDAPPGLPGASKILPYRGYASTVGFRGQYKFNTSGHRQETPLRRVADVAKNIHLVVFPTDYDNVDQSDYYDTVEAGDVAVWYDSATFWLAWQVLAGEYDTDVYDFSLAYLGGVQTDARDFSTRDITFRWSRAEGAAGAFRPPTIVNLPYDTPIPGAGSPDGAGEYKFTSPDGNTVYSTPAAIAAADAVKMVMHGTDAEDNDRTQTYFYDLQIGDQCVMYRDTWFVAWRVDALTGPTGKVWNFSLAKISEYQPPADALAGVTVRIGFDRLPSALTTDTEAGTLTYDSVENLGLEIYPGDTAVTFFWDRNSGLRSLDSDIYKIGTRIRYRAKGATDWITHHEETSSPETVSGLVNDTVYEFEFRIEYRTPPNYVAVYGDSHVVEARPEDRPAKVLAEYRITAGTWADSDGSPSFVGYFTANHDVFAEPPPKASRGRLQIVHSHPRMAPVGAIAFSKRTGISTLRYFDLAFGLDRRGQNYRARNDRNAFFNVRIVGHESLELLRTGASFNYADGASVWTWSVDDTVFVDGVTYTVQLLRLPPPLPTQVPEAFIIADDTRRTLYWAPPANHIDADIQSYRVRTRPAGQAGWTVRAAAQAPQDGINTYLLPSALTGNFEIEITATGIKGEGPPKTISNKDVKSVLRMYSLPAPNRVLGLIMVGSRPDAGATGGGPPALDRLGFGRGDGTGAGRRFRFYRVRNPGSTDSTGEYAEVYFSGGTWGRGISDRVMLVRDTTVWATTSGRGAIIPFQGTRFPPPTPGVPPPFRLAQPDFTVGIGTLKKLNAFETPSTGRTILLYVVNDGPTVTFRPEDLIPVNIYSQTTGKVVIQGWGINPPWDSTVDVFVMSDLVIIGDSR